MVEPLLPGLEHYYRKTPPEGLPDKAETLPDQEEKLPDSATPEQKVNRVSPASQQFNGLSLP
ncbi:MAG: hypothetical protein PHQ23_03060 [Candidatus Wallbacteria bacterium]|nr:hypothetical protein [Candidatus Wallbacteria bacterium]